MITSELSDLNIFVDLFTLCANNVLFPVMLSSLNCTVEDSMLLIHY